MKKTGGRSVFKRLAEWDQWRPDPLAERVGQTLLVELEDAQGLTLKFGEERIDLFFMCIEVSLEFAAIAI